MAHVRSLSSVLAGCTILACAATASGAQAQQVEDVRRTARATRIDEGEVRTDGRLNELAWQRAEIASDFTQRDPADGSPASERTEVRILFSDEAVYVAVRAFDSRPDAIGRNRLVGWTRSRSRSAMSLSR